MKMKRMSYRIHNFHLRRARVPFFSLPVCYLYDDVADFDCFHFHGAFIATFRALLFVFVVSFRYHRHHRFGDLVECFVFDLK